MFGAKGLSIDCRFGRVIVNSVTDNAAYIVGYEYDENYDVILKLSNGESCHYEEVSLRPLKIEEKEKLLKVKKRLEMFCSDGEPLTRPSII